MRIPASTYRLQLGPDFGFEQAEAIIPYLDALGISDLYLSPILAPRSDSTHGYDVVDPTRLNPALGSREAFERLAERAGEYRMGILLDIVPNHMAASSQNPWWRDVLARGRKSKFADFFDIDWQPPWPGAGEQILVPVLGDHYEAVLERGELQVERDEDTYVLRYFDQTFPLKPASRRRLDDETVAQLNEDLDALDSLLVEQHYQLRHWKSARFELNYRRFFNITDLVGLRIEDAKVRPKVHRLLGELWEQNLVTGLRVDHIDGLREPRSYLQWLRETFRAPAGSRAYVLVEKILAPREHLEPDWPVAGTTGYDFLNKVNGVFVDPDGHRKIDRIYAEFTGRQENFRTVVFEKKRFMVDWLFRAELDQMRAVLVELAASMRRGRDLTGGQLAEALAAVSAGLGVYRTYTQEPPVTDRDRERIEHALATAREFRPQIDPAAYDFIERLLLLEVPEEACADALEFVRTWQQFTPPLMAKGLEDTSLYVYNHLISLNTVGGEPDEGDVSLSEFHEFNQRRLRDWPGAMNSTSTHDSKRGEDARLRVDVLSEMPGQWKARLQRWAQWNSSKKMPADLAEPPGRNEEILLYQTLLASWPLDDAELDAYPERLRSFLIKSAREAKEKTSWHEADERHEHALVRFAERILDGGAANQFREDFLEFHEHIAFFGALYSLSQVVLKTAAPGVPDFYQGSEFWNLSLVDPDNRRPVDFDARRNALEEMVTVPDDHLGAYAVSLLREWQDARIKQFVTWRALRLRRQLPALFAHGTYRPLYARDKTRPYICAFCRSHEGRHVIAAAPRRLTRIVEPFDVPVGAVWEGGCLRMPDDLPRRWRSALTGEVIEVNDAEDCGLELDDVFASLPVALLRSE